MKKPIIRITWTKMHAEDMRRYGLTEQEPIYKLFLPWCPINVDWQTDELPCLSTCNPNEALAAIICRDINDNIGNTTPIMQIGNKSLVFGDGDWQVVYNAPMPKYPSQDSRDKPNQQ